MAASMRNFLHVAKLTRISSISITPQRLSNRLPNESLEKHRRSKLSQQPLREDESDSDIYPVTAPREYRHVYPEFLPEPNWINRDYLVEKLERRDMLRRRQKIDMPEFYVGSIMAVTVSDQHAPGKQNRFVGLCIQSGGHGLRAHFTLRNIVDGLGVEIMYEMYNPTIQKIEVLKLEKRLDDELFYLRDAPQEYCVIPFDIPHQPHPKGAPVPVNTLKVPLGPRPWHDRWERRELKGAIIPELPEIDLKRAERVATPWEKYDLMKQYRKSIPGEEQEEIYADVYRTKQQLDKDLSEKHSQSKSDT